MPTGIAPLEPAPAPWWLRVLAVWFVSRVVTTGIVLAFAAGEPATYWAPARPPYLRFAQFWDSGWFATIAAHGYPLALPVDASGPVLPNAWAFLPGYPAVVAVVMDVTRLPWDVASVVVAAGCSLGAALVLDRLLAAVLGRPAPFAVALFCFSPLSPLYQVAYAESMAVLLIALLLLLLVQRRYVALLPVIVLTGLTRPVAVPVAGLLVAHVVIRLVRRRSEPIAVRSLLAALGAVLVALVSAVAWPTVAALATGQRNAYLASELAWRRSDVLVPVVPWLDAARTAGGPVAGPIVLGVLALAFAALLTLAPAARRLGVDVRLWCAAYVLYLVAVVVPAASTVRLLLPLFPLAGLLPAPRSRILRIAVLVACVAAQAAWFGVAWARWPVQHWSPP
jgi:hypothetical protein